MAYKPIYCYGGDGSDGERVQSGSASLSGWSAIAGDVDDFIFYYGGEYDDGDSGEYRSTR